MTKKNKNITIIIFILLLVGIAVYGYKIKGLFGQSIIPLNSNLGNCIDSQLTSFSIDHVDVVGTGSRIRIYGRTGGSECLQIALTPQQLDSYLNAKGLDATIPVYGNVKLLKYTRQFPIVPSGQYFRTIVNNAKTPGNGITREVVTDFCKSKYPNAIYGYLNPFGIDPRCVLTGDNGQYGTFTGVSYDDFDLAVTIGPETQHFTRSKIAGNIGSGSLDLQNGKARFEWQGNLNNLNNVNPPYQYDGRLVQSKWTLVDKIAYSTTQTAIGNGGFIGCMIGREYLGSSNLNSDADYDYCVNNFLSNLPSYSDQISNYANTIRDVAYDVNTDNNALFVSLKAPPFPTFILDIDASWAGIVPLAGKPKIVSCVTSQTLDSGSPKTVDFVIKNDAGSSAQFYGGLTCSGGVQGIINQFSINANEQKSMTAYLTPTNTNQAPLSGKCTLNINDLKGSNSDSCSFETKVNFVSGITCAPNSFLCDDTLKNVLQCSSDGKNKAIYQTCNLGCTVQAGNAQCKNESAPDKLDLGKQDCEDKAKASPLRGYTWVATNTEPSIWKKIFTLGFAQASTSGECKPVNDLYYIMGIVFLLIVVILVIFLPRRSGRKK